MQDAWFEWDDAKDARNAIRSRPRFEDARACFDDPGLVELADEAHSFIEERRRLIGAAANGQLLHVVFARRGDRVRLISVRTANKKERTLYEKEKR